MKNKLWIPLTIILFSCNNQSKDPVEKADSVNNQKLDSTVVSNDVLKTDQETSLFLVDAADGGMAEVELGTMAKMKGKNPAVKKFGEMMVRDHSEGNGKVKALAAARNVSLPTGLGEKNKELKEKLAKLSGSAFDNEYLDAMIADHKEDIFEFEKARDRSGEGGVKDFAVATLPMLKMHLDSAEAIRKRLE